MRWRSARGAALVEFAAVSLVLYLLLAATTEFGRLMFSAQGIQDAARLAARELALAPLPADITFEAALTYVDPVSGIAPVRDRIFNPACLVVDLGGFGSDAEIDAFFAAMPLVNQALRAFMFIDRGGTDSTLLRYPGALLNSSDPAATCAGRAAPFTVGIPRVVSRGAEGVETIDWIPIIEELRVDQDPVTGPPSGPFSLANEGTVALRVNYPYQAAMISAFTPSAAGPFESNLSTPIEANDGFNTTPPPAMGTLRAELDPTDDAYYGPYAGRYGLGRLATPLGKGAGVRPFRKLLAVQAIYRREVFQ